MSARDDARADLIAALEEMPDEAFSWLVLATAPSAKFRAVSAQIWPDGIGGFTQQSREQIARVRAAADAYVAAST